LAWQLRSSWGAYDFVVAVALGFIGVNGAWAYFDARARMARARAEKVGKEG